MQSSTSIFNLSILDYNLLPKTCFEKIAEPSLGPRQLNAFVARPWQRSFPSATSFISDEPVISENRLSHVCASPTCV